jgi:hypothetical protein
MKIVYYILLLATMLLLQSCNQTNLYNQKTKTLDSLNGALNLKVKELEKTDTALLQRCITRFTYYRQFVKQNVKDTLSKNEADNLQRFYESGKNLQSFWSNRFTILGRASLINSQQSKLTIDLKSKIINPEEAEPSIKREKEATTELIDAANAQQKIYYMSLEEFKTSLHEVENLIRIRNKGELPTIIKDTVAL